MNGTTLALNVGVLCKPFGAFIMHTSTGSTAPITELGLVLHLLLFTLRHQSAGANVDPTDIVREHLAPSYKKVGSRTIATRGLPRQGPSVSHMYAGTS